MGKGGKGGGVGGDNRLRVVCTGSIDESVYSALGWFRIGAHGRLGRERATPGGNYLQVPRRMFAKIPTLSYVFCTSAPSPFQLA